MRFASIVGARPQFIKLAPVSRALRKTHDEILVHTGQHYDYAMSAQFFEELSLPEPDYNLEIGSGSHDAQTARMITAIEQVLMKERPDWVVVFGDTNSTLAGALAAAKLGIPIAHVEAGLRSYNRAMPEEINRVLTDHLSTRLYCPTERAHMQARSEGLIQGVETVGDVMYDVLLHMQDALDARVEGLLTSFRTKPQAYILATVHRPVNTDDAEAMHNIAYALNKLEMPIIFPLHPRTRTRLQGSDIEWGKHIEFTEPVGYLDMLTLERSAYRILTDSGGVQKEAFLMGVPCVTLREETEWPETVELGWNTLVGNRWQAIVEAVYGPMPTPALSSPFGKGDAALRIAKSMGESTLYAVGKE